MATAQTEPSPEERRALFRVIRVIRGEPTDAEVAALTVVLAAVAASAAVADPPAGAGTRSAWSEPAAQLRTPLTVGAGAWRTSTWRR